MFCTSCFGHAKDCTCGTLQPKPACIHVVEVCSQRADPPTSVSAVGAALGTTGTRLDSQALPGSWVTMCGRCGKRKSLMCRCKKCKQPEPQP